MFKNAFMFRIAGARLPDAETFLQALGTAAFVGAGPTTEKSMGFVPPRGHDFAPLLEVVNGQYILSTVTETRSVPAATLRERVDQIAAEVEKVTGRKPGKKQRKELAEQAKHELLPNAFPRKSSANVWINPRAEIMLVDTGSMAKADEIVTLLVRAVPDLAVSLIQTEMSPQAAMAHWLGTGEAPYGFTVDRECELKSTDEMKSVVRYGRHPLDTDEVKQHIIAGKVPTKLALTWRDRVSFVLTESGALRKLHFLDVLFEGPNKHLQQGDTFDADAAITTGELVDLIGEVIDAMGGEVKPGGDLAGPAASKSTDDAETEADAPAWA